MKQYLLNCLKVMVIVVSAGVTFLSFKSGLKDFGLLVTGLILRDFLSAKIYDPLFKDQSAQGWAIGEIKKLATRRRPASKYQI